MSRPISLLGHGMKAVLVALFALASPRAASSQTTWYVDDNAPNDPGSGDPTVSDPNEDGSPEHPFDAIQEGIDASAGGDTVLVLDGVYTGTGNKDLDCGGKAITVRSENGPNNCIIDLKGSGRGFYFLGGEGIEGPDSIVDGLTITNGHADSTIRVESGQAIAAREQLKFTRDPSPATQDLIKTVETLKPSVVYIHSIRKIEVDSRVRRLPFPGQSPFIGSPFDDDFFERFLGNRFRRGPQRQQFVQRGFGTGVIVSRDGYIVTINHVVDDATDITVSLSDNRTFDAKVVGTDEKTDLAILKINASDLMPAELADSEGIKVGERVLAMGNAFGLFPPTVSLGIISAKGRSNVRIAEYGDFIQTDAVINPGSSGGPLVNLDGEVIGIINTAIATRNGSYQGVGFAIPANMVKQVMEAIIDDGKVVRGWLGVSIQNLTEELTASFDFKGTDGVLIGDVIDDGPGGKAGLRPGDIVVQFDGKRVEDMNQFRNRVAATKPGSQVEMEVFRDGKRKKLIVEIGELE